MDCSKVGALIQKLRMEKQLTQRALAEQLGLSDKTISKWERGLGCPDVSVLSTLSKILGVELDSLLTGEQDASATLGGNMKRVQFYVCPACGNLLTATGEASISCCGRRLEPLAAEKPDPAHRLNLEAVENDWYVTSGHEMTKPHHITFVALVTGDKLFLVKLYPEWGLGVRFPCLAHGQLYFYCTQHGLFSQHF